jgi:hypothetical protein
MISTITIQCPNDDCEGEIVREIEAVEGESATRDYPGTSDYVYCTDALPELCPHCGMYFDLVDNNNQLRQSDNACTDFTGE